MSEGDGFFSRWSQRKTQQRRGEPPAQPPVLSPPPSPERIEGKNSIDPTEPPVAPPAARAAAPVEPAPTLDDVADLTPASDFSRFVTRDVDAGVKNAALKKLFADPHFNVMDGLDTYIDDYGKPDPLPLAMLRQMAESRWLGLSFDTPDETSAAAPHDTFQDPPAATSLPAATAPADRHEDPDLRLQPNDAAGRPGDEPRAGDDARRER